MIKLADGNEEVDLTPNVASDARDRGQNEVTDALRSAQDTLAQRALAMVPEAEDAEPVVDALEDVQRPLATPQRYFRNTATEKLPPTDDEPTSEPPSSRQDLQKDLKRGGLTAAAGAGIGATAFAAMTSAPLLVSGAPPALVATAGGIAALGGAWNVGVAGASLYGAGMLHKWLWNTPKEKSGPFHTIGRGLISGVSLPLGLFDNVFLNGRIRTMLNPRKKAA